MTAAEDWPPPNFAMPRTGLLRATLAGIALAWAALCAPAVFASDEASRAEIAATLEQWKADFNAGRSDKVCDLFARDLRADFRGQPERGYDALCDLLQGSLADRERAYSYELEVRDILVEGDLATVLLTWTLTVRQLDTGLEVTTVEPGLDVFRREDDDRWRIARYLAYEQ
jgi:uncharacterized protein (TIGR02246 family)